MAVVVVLVGQCGNQLGDELFTQLRLCNSTAPSGTALPYFTQDGLARCVLVDTEPKVVLGVQHRHQEYIRPSNVIHGQSGRGNNWGLGYYGVKTAGSTRNEDNAAVQRAFRNMGKDQREEDDNVLKRALQAIHAETRRTRDCAVFEAVLIIHSLVGGTGSGMASRLTEKIRQYFIEPIPGEEVDDMKEVRAMQRDGIDSLYGEKRRALHLVNITVAPRRTGEVAIQGLNAALTLQVLQRKSDAVVLLRNDDAMAPGEEDSSSVSAGTSTTSSLISRCITFKEVNELLISMLLPVLGYGTAAGCVSRLLQQLVPPFYQRATGGNKILTIVPTPQRVYGALKQTAHRILFVALAGGRTMMPGYTPEVPVGELLSRSALKRSGGGEGQSPPAKQQRLSGGAARRANPARGARPTIFSSPQEQDEEQSESHKDREKQVYMEATEQVPSALYRHFESLRKAPVKKLYESIEGVLVLNEARELNEKILFPLLRSAAVKTYTGAFLSYFGDVGVKPDRIQNAYHEVAEIMACSEAL